MLTAYLIPDKTKIQAYKVKQEKEMKIQAKTEVAQKTDDTKTA
jgi:hypothetical protein